MRIRTFGYDANWGKRSILNIHDFAKDLLTWLKNSPTAPQGCLRIGKHGPRMMIQIYSGHRNGSLESEASETCGYALLATMRIGAKGAY